MAESTTNPYTRDDAITINPSAIPFLFDYPIYYTEQQYTSVLKVGDIVHDESGKTKVFLGTDQNGCPAWALLAPLYETIELKTDDAICSLEEFRRVYGAHRSDKEQGKAKLSDELFKAMLNAENN